MTIKTAVCTSYLRERYESVHALQDTYKLALIRLAHAGEYGRQTSNYSGIAADECAGPGYPRGGVDLQNTRLIDKDGSFSLGFDDARLDGVTLDGDEQPVGAMIYNVSKGGRAVAILDYGKPVRVVQGVLHLPIDRPVRAIYGKE